MLRSEVGKATRLSINEVYPSVQGEGLLVGMPSLFIRFQGCPIRCPWCDQPSALSFEEDNYTLTELLKELSSYPHKHVVITGGEPMAHPSLTPLVRALCRKGYSVQIETNGTLWREGLEGLDLHITCSPKWSARWFVHEEVLKRAKELKFVVDEVITEDVVLKPEFRGHLREGKVVLQPEGNKREFIEKALSMQESLLEKGFSVRVIPQVHKIIGLR